MNQNEQTSMIFSSELPYPPIQVTCQNKGYAAMLLSNASGPLSEMTALAQYRYNNLVTNDYENLPYIFHMISVVEMHHMQIFLALALALGENPRLWTHKGRQMSYWSPAYCYYPASLKDLLHQAVNSEHAAVSQYEEQCGRIEDPCIVENLRRIIMDEEIHISILDNLILEHC